MIKIRKALTGTIAALALGATVLASVSPANADWRSQRHNGGGRRGGGNGGAIAAGIIGGLALGALAAGAARSQPRSYYAPAPAYEPVYSPEVCYDVEKRVYNRWGQFLGYRMVTVCE